MQAGAIRHTLDGTGGFSTLEVRANRASEQRIDMSCSLFQFQYPRSSGQSCKDSRLSHKTHNFPFQYPRSSGQSCKGIVNMPILVAKTVSVPSKFGPIVQEEGFEIIPYYLFSFSTLEVRANRASSEHQSTSPLPIPFQYPRSSGQSCKCDSGRHGGRKR